MLLESLPELQGRNGKGSRIEIGIRGRRYNFCLLVNLCAMVAEVNFLLVDRVSRRGSGDLYLLGLAKKRMS